MPNFKDLVVQDIHNVFLNPNELADLRTVRYDGNVYENIPVSLQGLTLEQRQALSAAGTGRSGSDSAQGLFTAHAVMYCAVRDLGGKVPKQGNQIEIGQGNGFFRRYLIATVTNEMGMLELELEATRQ